MIQRILILITLGLLLSSSVMGQGELKVSLDTNMLLIGDQTHLVMEVEHPKDYQVQFPVFSDTIIDKLEILDILNADTVLTEEAIKVTQRYLVTSFDSGFYQIPPMDFVFMQNGAIQFDTIQSNPLYFGVMTMQLDTANPMAVADIKSPVDAPLTFKEVLPFVLYGFGGLLVLALAIYLYLVLVKKKPVTLITKEKPKEPAHIIAFSGLDQLKDKKLWQQGKLKEYYIELTEIIRVYLEDRFNVMAMEMTTDEIMDAFGKNKELEKELKDSLFDVLTRADFVKFAKGSAMPEENEASLQFAYHLVTQTKPVIQLRDEEESEKQSEE